jgi:hypothetical protein
MKAKQLPVSDPCQQPWRTMQRSSDGTRRCQSCNTKVHDVSAMTKSQAKRFLDDDANHDACIRYMVKSGDVVFAEPVLAADSLLPRIRNLAAAALVVAGAQTMVTSMAKVDDTMQQRETSARSKQLKQTNVEQESLRVAREVQRAQNQREKAEQNVQQYETLGMRRK